VRGTRSCRCLPTHIGRRRTAAGVEWGSPGGAASNNHDHDDSADEGDCQADDTNEEGDCQAGDPPKKATTKPTPPPGPPDCANASAAEVARIIGRKVQPVAVTSGCAWGTRLDDASTLLVTIRMSAGHSAFDSKLVTSVKQRRVVYGSGLDAGYHMGTALWVATGQPITKGKSGVTARADTHVVVARAALNISDDRARQLALAIAAAANGTG
jgi:hypothetical protein